MKLYEFTVTDEFDLPKSEILAAADSTAMEQSGLMEWGTYKVIERQTPERLATGEMRYYFAIEGEYADSANPDNDRQTHAPSRTTRGSAAAPEL
ncbi:MAG: hypothetical protein NTV34_13565 [Proteobacteria bacterium]|nr:hypothetical protein [Pseudomonadota bacterium]